MICIYHKKTIKGNFETNGLGVLDKVTLRLLAKEVANVIGLSKVSIDVDFIEFSKTKEYENYKYLQTVNVGDLVIVRHKNFRIDVKVPVIKIKKDVLNSVNIKVELGQPRDSILDQLDMVSIKTTLDELGNKVAKSSNSMLYYANPVALKVDTGTLNIPMFNLQCMIDGRNLQGGLSTEPPYTQAPKITQTIKPKSIIVKTKDDIVFSEVYKGFN